mgnify:CR=1 FL=1
MNNKEKFEQCITTSRSKGRVIIKCKLGLWDVSANDLHSAMKQGYYYWSMYNEDGEYDE